ncbi:unnamed protein product, partial [marine sediment metagenome]
IFAAIIAGLLWGDLIIGTMTFYFGTDNQVPNEQITADMAAGLTTMSRNLPYRNMCWAFFKDIHLGRSNRCPNFKFILQKKLSLSFDP